MIWTKNSFWRSRAEKLAQWNYWLAWHPVTMTGTEKRAWMHVISRRRVEYSGGDTVARVWEYKE